MSTIADNLRRMRRQRGLSQQALSLEAGIAENVVSLIEAGRREPRQATLRALAAALGVGVGEFFATNPQAAKAREERA